MWGWVAFSRGAGAVKGLNYLFIGEYFHIRFVISVLPASHIHTLAMTSCYCNSCIYIVSLSHAVLLLILSLVPIYSIRDIF